MKRPRKVRAFNRVQPRMTEEDQRRQQFISPSKHKLNPYLMMHFTRTEQYTAGTAVPPWGTSIVYMNGLNSTAAFGVPSITQPVACDTYYSGVSLLLPFAGTNGSTTFTDYSISPKTITANGNAQISTAQSKFGGASGYFDGTGDYITPAGSADFQFGTGNFTIEGWIKSTTTGFMNGPFGQFPNNTDNGRWDIKTRFSGANNLIFTYYTGSTYVDLQASPSVNLNDDAWHHIAVCRSGNTLYLFSDGVQRASAAISGSQIIGLGTSTLNIGYNPTDNAYYTGYVDDFRITKGIARYVSNFTVPSSAFTTSDCFTCDVYYNSTSLILPMNGTNGSTTFTDSSPSPKTVTANGDTQISTAQSKWNGSSGYFDGNSDFLSTPDNAAFDFGSGDFCVEGWIYPTSFTGVDHIVGQWDGPGDQTWHIHVFTDGIFSMEYSTSGNYQPANFLSSSAGVLVANTWAHVAAARSGNTLRIFVNGVVVGSKDVTGITIYSASTASIKVGGNTNSQWYAGYMNDVRITKGVARYTSNFTVPTSANPTVVCT